MAAAETVLIVRQCTFNEVRGLLVKAFEKGDHTGGALTIEEACAGATQWAVETAGGAVVMAYAMRSSGITCWIVAAAGGMPGVDLTRAVLPVIAEQARAMGCEQLAVTTKRGGLMTKLDRAGWTAAAITYRKKIV
jgi:hypothetical protein